VSHVDFDLAVETAHLARQKCPRSIGFEAELPRLSIGKLYKRLLRDGYWKAWFVCAREPAVVQKPVGMNNSAAAPSLVIMRGSANVPLADRYPRALRE
jgi:hypothetical protein